MYMKKLELQPAEINYFFRDGFIEFKDNISAAFSACAETISDSWEDTGDHFYDVIGAIGDVIDWDFLSVFAAIGHAFMTGLCFGKCIISAIFTPILVATLALVQILILIPIMAMIYLTFSIVAFVDWIYRKLKKISTSCPQCQEKYDLPTYVCTCGAKHTRLIPSKYGIFTRKCNCGAKLKTTFFNGRQKLPGKWECPECGYRLGGTAMAVNISIPVVGWKASGKSNFINMAISQLEKNAESEYNLDFKYIPNKDLGDDYEQNKSILSRGLKLQATNDNKMKYYQFYLTPKDMKVKNIISLCDIAGEAYDGTSKISGQIGFKYANAFLILVDPLSIEKYRIAAAKKINIEAHGDIGTVKPMDEVLDVLINVLENINCLNSKNMIKTDVAVVFTKCDLYGLSNYIGAPAVKKYLNENKKSSVYEATNAVCEDFLLKCGEQNFLKSLKAKFGNIQFFVCSALGHEADNGEKYNPIGVEDPVLWLIDKVSSSIDLKEKWGKKL